MRGRDLDPAGLTDRPEQLRRWLTEHGVFSFEPYRSGLFPASDLPAEQRTATGMGMAWFRDNSHVAMALLDDGRAGEAARTGSAMLSVLRAHRQVLRGETSGYLPVRVEGDTLAADTEPRVQHDSTGYALWLICRLVRDGHLPTHRDDLTVLSETVAYLVRHQYWHAPDDGHWEEERRVHASSIGTVVAGLTAAATLFDKHGFQPGTDLRTAIRLGISSLTAILKAGRTELPPTPDQDPDEATAAPVVPIGVAAPDHVRGFLDGFDTLARRHDAALLFLVEPLGVLTGSDAAAVADGIENNLVRRCGVARYRGDTYWEPRFPDILSIDERTTAAEGRTEQRNLTAAGVAFTETEAQWTLFDPILSSYWGRRYYDSGHPEHRERQLHHLRRSLSQLVAVGGGRRCLPEAYYLQFDHDSQRNRWIGNDHTPLLWSHANLLRAVGTLEQTSR